MFDDGEESDELGDTEPSDESEGEKMLNPGAEVTPAHSVGLRRIDTLGQFAQGVGVEVAVDANDSDSGPASEGEGPPLPHRLDIAGISRDTADAAGEFLAGALIGVETPMLRVNPSNEMRPPVLPLLPASRHSSAGAAAAAEGESARGVPVPLSLCRIDTMDLLRVPTCEPSPLQGLRFGIPAPEIPGLIANDSLDMLRLPSATPSPVLDRPVAVKRQRDD